MPIVKEPRPLPSPLDYVPPNSVTYEPTAHDSFDSLAQRPDMQNAGVSSYDRCYFNFKTRNPAEINWYLYHKVGCRHATRDHANYMFSMADDPGIVYLPKAGAILPAHETKEEPAFNAWLGIVCKAGTMFVVDGIETVAGAVVSLDDPTKWMAIGASVSRLGIGWGATGGFSFVLITGVSKPQQLNRYQDMSTDFNVALGKNWGKMLQAGAKYKKFKPIIEAMAKIGAKTPDALKKLVKTEPDRYFDLVKAVRSVRDYGNLKAEGDPEVFMWDVPFVNLFGDLGAEVSFFKALSTFNAMWDGT
jgi:hypothetical protein